MLQNVDGYGARRGVHRAVVRRVRAGVTFLRFRYIPERFRRYPAQFCPDCPEYTGWEWAVSPA